ncbi:hypothetical protein [Vibrio aestuarianus]|uniref:hypothetical protein n=1 Tax=Vibrio aestuarianus TaxID=28171 RepID=UPI00237CC19F|nr:hypothetical protein [Vibrio aestuarianus]MDE1231611.1 hypothetical protein [Vibrio aestuarianus]
MINKNLLSMVLLVFFSGGVYASVLSQELQDCPTKMVYSYPSANEYTAYSTDFSSSPVLFMSITFQNLSSDTLALTYPQVWTNEDNPQSEVHSPYSSLNMTPSVVQPGEEFTISGIVDTTTVPATDNILTIRPQFSYRGWFGDVEKYAPIVKTDFICLQYNNGILDKFHYFSKKSNEFLSIQ